MKILIIDDHAVVRKGLERILLDSFPTARIGEAGHADEAMALCDRESWDLLVLDISMPGKNGLELLKDLHSRRKLPVLVLSIHPESNYAIRALKSGAAGYLNKQSAPEELVRAVRKVLSGGRYISAEVAEKLACNLYAGEMKPPHEMLSDREYEVMCLLASGMGLKQTAIELSISPKTVSTYRTRILEKMNLKSNADLTLYAIQNHLVPRLDP